MNSEMGGRMMSLSIVQRAGREHLVDDADVSVMTSERDGEHY